MSYYVPVGKYRSTYVKRSLFRVLSSLRSIPSDIHLIPTLLSPNQHATPHAINCLTLQQLKREQTNLDDPYCYHVTLTLTASGEREPGVSSPRHYLREEEGPSPQALSHRTATTGATWGRYSVRPRMSSTSGDRGAVLREELST